MFNVYLLGINVFNKEYCSTQQTVYTVYTNIVIEVC